LSDESTPDFSPQIDAILLSKFDTVDDKVGTALSLVYSTSKPILFVGVGQKYPNLK
jgi:signal recognition particle receptor subunit alpha